MAYPADKNLENSIQSLRNEINHLYDLFRSAESGMGQENTEQRLARLEKQNQEILQGVREIKSIISRGPAPGPRPPVKPNIPPPMQTPPKMQKPQAQPEMPQMKTHEGPQSMPRQQQNTIQKPHQREELKPLGKPPRRP